MAEKGIVVKYNEPPELIFSQGDGIFTPIHSVVFDFDRNTVKYLLEENSIKLVLARDIIETYFDVDLLLGYDKERDGKRSKFALEEVRRIARVSWQDYYSISSIDGKACFQIEGLERNLIVRPRFFMKKRK